MAIFGTIMASSRNPRLFPKNPAAILCPCGPIIHAKNNKQLFRKSVMGGRRQIHRSIPKGIVHIRRQLSLEAKKTPPSLPFMSEKKEEKLPPPPPPPPPTRLYIKSDSALPPLTCTCHKDLALSCSKVLTPRLSFIRQMISDYKGYLVVMICNILTPKNHV